ncbi:MAG TPA: hypothetical protein VLX68_01950 [Chitinivibrionales bacterium]|nr:hypothetical protein [Chitinivibrionales bacterium]
MSFDATMHLQTEILIQKFVEYINASHREPGDEWLIPEALRLGMDEYGYYDWKIQKKQISHGIEIEGGPVCRPLPEDFIYLFEHYYFPGFDLKRMFLFGNTPDNKTPFDWTHCLADGLARKAWEKRGLIQIGRPEQYNIDSICLDTKAKKTKFGHPLIRVFREDILLDRRKWNIDHFAESFRVVLVESVNE